jgi:pyruvate/2-oxoglutarate dehydrogenase complex dihydrolipoamide acyltransferase (E2) component
MIYSLAVPGPIDNVEELRVLQWHGEPGHAFAPGELMVELETHKAIVEVRAAQPGILREVRCAEGQWQPVGAALALLSDAADEALPAPGEPLAAMTVQFDFC